VGDTQVTCLTQARGVGVTDIVVTKGTEWLHKQCNQGAVSYFRPETTFDDLYKPISESD